MIKQRNPEERGLVGSGGFRMRTWAWGLCVLSCIAARLGALVEMVRGGVEQKWAAERADDESERQRAQGKTRCGRSDGAVG
ncbi:hypothetical protein Tco_0093023 [Tanacetum coccineum]